MTRRVSKDFFKPGPIAFLGYSSKQPGYCGEIAEALRSAGLEVHPVNPRPSASLPVPAKASLAELPKGTEQAFLLLAGEHALAAVEELGKLGYRRLLLRSGRGSSAAALGRATELGMEVAVGCPLMAYGKGFHRFHGLLAGVR